MELDTNMLAPAVGGVMVVLGIVYTVVRSAITKRSLAAVDRWIHGAFSIWTGGEDCATWAQPRAQESLKSWYGATNATSLREVIAGLRRGQTGNAAWDKVRALDLLRIGLAAGYFDAEQVRIEGAAIGREIQGSYRAWEELATAFEAGMRAWQQSRNVTDPQETGRVQRNLPKLRADIWPAVAYDTKLVVDED